MVTQVRFVALVALAVLLACPLDAEARWRLFGCRHHWVKRNDCCTPSGPPSAPAPTEPHSVAPTEPRSIVCARFYFGPVGNLHLHYGGTPPCIFAATKMYYTQKFCSPLACPCNPTDPDSHCEEVSSARHLDHGIAKEVPGEKPFFPPDVFQSLVYTETTGIFKDKDGASYYLRLYKVALPSAWAKHVGKDIDYLGFQVVQNDGFEKNATAELKVKQKRATIKISAPSQAAGTYEVVLFDEP